MSNLTDLLPSGGSGKGADFVASGTLGNGDTVVLKADGTIEVVGESSTSVSASMGTESVFNSAESSYNSVVVLDSNTALVTYSDQGNSSSGTACVLNISGTTITANNEHIFNYGITIYPSVTKLDSNTALVTYRDAGNSQYGTAQVLSVSGLYVSGGNKVVFNSSFTTDISLTTLDSTKAIVTYNAVGTSDYGTACVLSVSGATVTAGSAVVFNSAPTYNTSVTTLDSTKALVVYADNGQTDRGTACVLSISGTAITAGSESVFNNVATYNTSVTTLDSSKALVAYRDVGNSEYGTSCVLSISGTTVTAGSEYVFNTGITRYISVTTLDSTKAVVTYKDYSNSNYGTACVLSVSGTTVAAGSEVVFNSDNTSNISVTTLDSTKAVVTYLDYDGISFNGTSVVYQTAYTVTTTNLESNNFVGMATEAASDGATTAITLKGGVSTNQTGLTIGSDYYVQDDGTLSTTTSTVKAGKALTATTLRLTGE